MNVIKMIWNFKFAVLIFVGWAVTMVKMWDISTNNLLWAITGVAGTLFVLCLFFEIVFAAASRNTEVGEKAAKRDDTVILREGTAVALAMLVRDNEDYDTGPEAKRSFLAAIGADVDNG